VTEGATAHRSGLSGVEALTRISARGFPRHAHDQFGVGVIDFGGHRSWSGAGSVEAGPGDVIMVNPGEIHDGAPIRGAARGWRMLYLDPQRLLQENAEDLLDRFEWWRPAVTDPIVAHHFSRAFDAVIAPIGDGLDREEALRLLLMALTRDHRIGRRLSAAPPPPVARALARIDSAPELPTSLAELAGLSGVSRFQLLRGFRRAVGMTPYAYLLQRRAGRAKRLLTMGRTPAECAVEAGFADQSHMTRAFVRQFGVTPGRYRDAIL